MTFYDCLYMFSGFVSTNRIEIVNYVYFIDKAWFHLDGYVNSKTVDYGVVKILMLLQNKLHAHKIGVWCANSHV